MTYTRTRSHTHARTHAHTHTHTHTHARTAASSRHALDHLHPRPCDLLLNRTGAERARTLERASSIDAVGGRKSLAQIARISSSITWRCNSSHCIATQHDALQHSTTRCNTARRAATQHDALQHSTTRCNTARRAATQHDALQHLALRCNTARRAATRHDAGLLCHAAVAHAAPGRQPPSAYARIARRDKCHAAESTAGPPHASDS
jgi:hypothetical protein